MPRLIRPFRLIVALSGAVLLAYLAVFLEVHQSPNLYYLRRAFSLFPSTLLNSGSSSPIRPSSPTSIASFTTTARAAAAMSSTNPPSGSGSSGPDMTSEGCGEIPRIENPRTYKPKGVEKKTPAGMTYYEVIPEKLERPDLAIIQYYDVIGPESDQTRQQADRLSYGLGCKVVMPDFFMQGTGYPGILGRGHTRESMWEWLERVAPFDAVVERTKEIQGVLKEEGITRFAQVGHCWGGMTGIHLAQLQPPLFLAAGLIHGRSYNRADALAVRIPVANFPSAMEGGPQSDFHNNLPSGEIGNWIKEKSIFKLFGDMQHGFSSGRGDWSTPYKKKRAEEVIQDYADFVWNLL